MPMPQAPLAPSEKLYCLSYSPFRSGQSPFDPKLQITPEQIDEDLTQLAHITDCVRTYSVELGQDQVASIARRHGLKVIQGMWLGTKPDKNRAEIDTAVKIANQYPDVVRALVVGNEVLLRGDMAVEDLDHTIRAVKARVQVPVTYADVWEFWLRNTQVAAAADFITIHILPYWEDFPIAADHAAAHVDQIRRRVVEALPGKEVIIGEFGWPSAGRMREGALPSPANQARVIQDVLALGKRENFHVNVIEAFDQPWKRAVEGTVGGHWGLLDAQTRAPKFVWGEAVSNHPQWKLQAAGGIAFAVLVLAVGWFARSSTSTPGRWLAVTVNAITGGLLIPWSIADVPVEGLGIGGWARSLALVTVAALAPPLLSAAILRGTLVPPFSRLIGPSSGTGARFSGAFRWLPADRAHAAGNPIGTRPGVRSALPGFSVCAAHRRHRAVPAAQPNSAASGRRVREVRTHGSRRVGAVGALYRAQREFRQLAVAVAVCGICGPGIHSDSGARWAKLSLIFWVTASLTFT